MMILRNFYFFLFFSILQTQSILLSCLGGRIISTSSSTLWRKTNYRKQSYVIFLFFPSSSLPNVWEGVLEHTFVSVRGTIVRWRRLTIPIVGLLSLSIKSPFSFSSLLPYHFLLAPTVERFSLALRSPILKSFCIYFICAFSPHICLQLVTILIIYVVSMYPCLNVWTLSLHDFYVWLSVCTLS
jgi:hypothetical protein